MSSPLKKLAYLQSTLIEREAQIAAKHKLIESQRKQILSLIIQNEKLKTLQSALEVQFSQKDEEISLLKMKVENLQLKFQVAHELRQESHRKLEAEKANFSAQCREKDAAIKKLQMEKDILTILNDESEEKNRRKQSEIDSLLAESNQKLYQAIQNERDRVKVVLENCVAVVTKLDNKVKESSERNVLVEKVLHTNLDKIEDFREALVEQQRAYSEWFELLHGHQHDAEAGGTAQEKRSPEKQNQSVTVSSE